MNTDVMFFGCLGTPGHYLYARNRRHLLYESSPWGTALDSGLLPKRERDYRLYSQPDHTTPDGTIYFAQKGGWTAIAFWDRSGDSRPASNSAFLVAAEISEAELLTLAREQWPEVFARPNFPLKPDAPCQP